LADAPAEQHVLAFALRREVEQAGIRVLQLHADQRQLVHDLLQLAGELRELGRARLADALAAAVAGDDPHDLALLVLELRETRAELAHPLGERTDLPEGAVSLVGREHAGGHGSESSMRRRLVAWILFVALISSIAYASRFAAGPPDRDTLYK